MSSHLYTGTSSSSLIRHDPTVLTPTAYMSSFGMNITTSSNSHLSPDPSSTWTSANHINDSTVPYTYLIRPSSTRTRSDGIYDSTTLYSASTPPPTPTPTPTPLSPTTSPTSISSSQSTVESTDIGIPLSTTRSSSPPNTSPLDTGSPTSSQIQNTQVQSVGSSSTPTGNGNNIDNITKQKTTAAILGVVFGSFLIFLCVFFGFRILARRHRVKSRSKFRKAPMDNMSSDGSYRDMVFVQPLPYRVAASRRVEESNQISVGLQGGDDVDSGDLHRVSQHPGAAGQQLDDPFTDPPDCGLPNERAERSSGSAPRLSPDSTDSTVSFSRPFSGDNDWLSSTSLNNMRNPHVGSTGHYTPHSADHAPLPSDTVGFAYTPNLTSWSKSLLETLNISGPSRRGKG